MIDNGEQIEVRMEPDAGEDALREIYAEMIDTRTITDGCSFLNFVSVLGKWCIHGNIPSGHTTEGIDLLGGQRLAGN